MADNVCIDDGVLVGMSDPIPDDVHEYYRVKEKIVGCNRVYCELCSSWVKRLDRYRIRERKLPRPEHERFYESLDTAQFDVLLAAPSHRTYLCRCNWADAFGMKRLTYGDIDGWSCAGHPST